MAAPVISSVATTSYNVNVTNATYSLNLPSGISVGDCLVVHFRTQATNFGVNGHAEIDGFSRVSAGDFGSTTNRYQALFFKAIVSVGDIPSEVWIEATTTNSSRGVVTMLRVSGADLSDPVIDQTSALGSITGTTITRQLYNTSANALDIAFFASEFGAGSPHEPTDYPEGFSTVLEATMPVGATTAQASTYVYVGSRVSDSFISTAASMGWSTVAGPAAMGISIRAIGGGGGDDDRQMPRVVGKPSYAAIAGSRNSFTIATPQGLRYGDILLIGYRTNGTSSPSDFYNSLFTSVGTPFIPYSSERRVVGLQYHKVLDVRDEPQEYTFTKDVADTRTVAAMVIVRGVELLSPISGESSEWKTAGNVVTISSLAVTEAPSLLIALFANEETAGWSTMPTGIPEGFVTIANQNQLGDPQSLLGTRTSIWMGAKEVPHASVTGDIVATWGVNSGNGNSAVALFGAEEVESRPGIPVPMPNGKTGYVSIAYSGELVTPTLAPHKNIYPTVTEMLSVPGITIAHRGGSLNWPEMSEFGYRECVKRGYQVLEFSAQRSIDGWWFGMHDNNFDRTSQVSGTLPPSFYTRAEIEANFLNVLNSDGTPRPYWGLRDFLNKYSQSHIVMVDPKNALGYTSEFLNLLDEYNGRTRAIVKYFGEGSGSIALANAAALRGYQTWGYFYPDNATDGSLEANQEHWSVLGMSWDAGLGAWLAVTSYGKKVIAHICSSEEQVVEAAGKGAHWFQCSNVRDIPAGRYEP